jgi:hypothetical protein
MATVKKIVAGRCCDNCNISWRYSISTKSSFVAPNAYRNGEKACSKKLVRQCELFVEILCFNKIHNCGVTYFLQRPKCLWHQVIATICRFCGDTLFQQFFIPWRQIVITSCIKNVVTIYCNNKKFFVATS